jgi:hypothetical protein
MALNKKKTSKKSGGKKKTSGTVEIGYLCVAQDGESYYIKRNPKVDISINGVDFEGDYINLNSPEDKFNFLLEGEYIDADEYNENIEKYSEGGDFESTQYFVSLKL